MQAVNDLAEGRLQVYSASYAILRPQREAGRITVAGADGQRAGAEPARHPDRHRGRFPRTEMDGNVGLFASQGRVRRRWSSGSAPTSSRSPTTRLIEDRLNATAQTPARGGAKEFAEVDRAQRAQIAKIAKTLDLKPTR